jgi:hypothetical protein
MNSILTTVGIILRRFVNSLVAGMIFYIAPIPRLSII